MVKDEGNTVRCRNKGGIWMEEIGVVVQTQGETAKVRMTRHSSCERCGACGMGGAREAEFTVLNPVGACPGQRVRIRVAPGTLYRAAFLVYIIPMIGLILGYLLGRWLAQYYGIGIEEEIGMFAGFSVMALSFIGLYRFDRRHLKPEDYLPEIIGLAEDEDAPDCFANTPQ